MKSLQDLIATNEGWLVARVLAYAKRHGYTGFSSTLEQPWRESICGFSEPMLDVLERHDRPLELTAGADYAHESIAAFAVIEARLHRERGVPIEMFLGLCKYYRQAYLDLVVEQRYATEDQERYRLFIERFFDHVEIAFCSEWLAVGDVEQLEETQAKNRELTNEKNKYLTIFESLSDPVILVDDQGQVENLNLAAAELFSQSPVPGEGYYAKHDYPLLERQLDGLIEQGAQPEGFERSLETAHGRRDFVVKTRRLLDISEKFVGRVLILSDVTEYKRARYEADAANRTKSAFLATMSHEIRTPITGILGIGRLLQEDLLGQRQSDYVAALVSSGEVLLALVNDVLDYSKIEAGAVAVEDGEFNLRDMMEQVVGIVATAAANKGLAISTHIEDAVPNRLRGDHPKIRRILLNLLTNAVKFTAAGSVKLSVSLRESAVRYAVTDTGMGISQDVRQTLFKPFMQPANATEANPAKGAGLGLAICKRLATAIGAELNYETQEGEGSTFWLDAPLLVAEGDAAAKPEPAEAPDLPTLRVLLVEDNEVNRLVTEGFLSNHGHDVTVVETGEAAVAAMADAGAELVLMDIRMQGMGGLNAIRAIRSMSDPAAASVPILVLTADLATTEEESCFEAGADGVLEKPFDPSSLNRAIGQCLTKARGRSTERAANPNGSDIILDRSVILEHSDQLGEERTRRIVETFCASAPDTLDAIRQAAGSGDLARLSDLAHSLKSAAGNVGLVRLRHTASGLEKAAGAAEQASVAEALDTIQDDVARSVAALRESAAADLVK